MMKRLRVFVAVLLTFACAPAFAAPSQAGAESVRWEDWSDEAFARAARENRLVLLDLEAVWCHWCHVMAEKTYGDPRVIELLGKHFVALRVDQATRPDLAARYEEYGWPATVVLNAKGQDLWKEAGFIEADVFLATLKKVLSDPKPRDDGSPQRPAPAADGLLTADLRRELEAGFQKALDTAQGGLIGVHRFLRDDAVEYALLPGSPNELSNKEWAKKTLDSSLKLIDPAWGGIYQYSTRRSWDNPHFEKIMSSQTKAIRAFAAGYAVFKDQKYLDAARSIRSYVKEFLGSSEGAFYASQDADLVRGQHSAEYFSLDAAARRAKGIPEVQKFIYARENGWMISALTALFAVTSEQDILAEAIAAARYIRAHRALPGGGFMHGEHDTGGPYLGDTLAMLEAYLELYRSTADRAWLEQAAQAGQFIIANFVDGALDTARTGVMSAKRSASPIFQPVYTTDENIDAARAANTLFQYTGKTEFRALAETALRYAGQPHVALEYKTEPGLLVADVELRTEPLHVTIVANKDDERGRELFLAANRYYAPYKRLEWWDKREGPLPRDDVQYPQLAKAAGFICTNKRCSLPIFDGARLAQTIELFRAKEMPSGRPAVQAAASP